MNKKRLCCFLSYYVSVEEEEAVHSCLLERRGICVLLCRNESIVGRIAPMGWGDKSVIGVLVVATIDDCRLLGSAEELSFI